jgi:hypothetical protein
MITSKLAKRLGLRPSGQELNRVFGLGGQSSLKSRPSYTFLLHPKQASGEINLDVSTPIYAIVEDTIAVPVPKVPKGDWLQVMYDRFLMLADDQVDQVTSETVDLLIAGRCD